MKLIDWPPRAQIGFYALAASIIGSGVAMAMTCWLIWIFWRGGWTLPTEPQRLETLAYISFGLVILAFVTITSMGMAINRRSVRIDGPAGMKVDMSGGGDDPTPAATPITTTTTKTEVSQ